MAKRALQIVTAILALVPIVTGLIGMSGVSDPLYAALKLPANPVFDSNLRFFAGVWFGLGVALFWLIPKIDQQTVLFRTLWGMVFAGGIGRLLSMLLVGSPPAPFIGFTILEIVGASIFIWWPGEAGLTG